MLCWLHHQSRAFANTSLTGHWSLATYLLGSSGSQYRFYGIKLLERCPLRQSVLQEQGSARNLGEATLMDMEEINLIETNIPRKPRSVRMIWFHFQRHIDLIIFSVCWSFSGEGDGLEQRAARNCSQIGGRPVIRSRSIGFHSSQPVLSRSPHSWGTVYVGKLPFPGGIGWWSKLGSTYKKTPAILELQHESYGPMVIFQENLLPWSQDLPPQPFRLILNGLMIIQQFDCRHPSQHSRTVGSEVGYFSCCSRRHWVVQTFFFFFFARVTPVYSDHIWIQLYIGIGFVVLQNGPLRILGVFTQLYTHHFCAFNHGSGIIIWISFHQLRLILREGHVARAGKVE